MYIDFGVDFLPVDRVCLMYSHLAVRCGVLLCCAFDISNSCQFKRKGKPIFLYPVLNDILMRGKLRCGCMKVIRIKVATRFCDCIVSHGKYHFFCTWNLRMIHFQGIFILLLWTIVLGGNAFGISFDQENIFYGFYNFMSKETIHILLFKHLNIFHRFFNIFKNNFLRPAKLHPKKNAPNLIYLVTSSVNGFGANKR